MLSKRAFILSFCIFFFWAKMLHSGTSLFSKGKVNTLLKLCFMGWGWPINFCFNPQLNTAIHGITMMMSHQARHPIFYFIFCWRRFGLPIYPPDGIDHMIQIISNTNYFFLPRHNKKLDSRTVRWRFLARHSKLWWLQHILWSFLMLFWLIKTIPLAGNVYDQCQQTPVF